MIALENVLKDYWAGGTDKLAKDPLMETHQVNEIRDWRNENWERDVMFEVVMKKLVLGSV